MDIKNDVNTNIMIKNEKDVKKEANKFQEFFDLVEDSPVATAQKTSNQTTSSSSFFASDDDDCIDDDFHELLNNVERNSLRKNQPEEELEFLIDQISGIPSTAGIIKVKAAIIKTRNVKENGKLFVKASIDDGTRQMEVIVSNKVTQQYKMEDEKQGIKLEGIFTIKFSNDDSLPILEDISPLTSCHINSLLGQVRNWGW